MKYLPALLYDAESDTTTVRGTTLSQSPYAIELYGLNAFVWYTLLRRSRYSQIAFTSQKRVSRLPEETDDETQP